MSYFNILLLDPEKKAQQLPFMRDAIAIQSMGDFNTNLYIPGK
jgi:hypothetical protein